MLHLRRTCNVAGTYRETSLQRHFDVLLPGGLCVFLSKMSAYREDFDEAKYISFLTENDELLEKYNKIWEKIVSKKNLIVNPYIMESI